MCWSRCMNAISLTKMTKRVKRSQGWFSGPVSGTVRERELPTRGKGANMNERRLIEEKGLPKILWSLLSGQTDILSFILTACINKITKCILCISHYYKGHLTLDALLLNNLKVWNIGLLVLDRLGSFQTLLQSTSLARTQFLIPAGCCRMLSLRSCVRLVLKYK